MTKLSDEIEEEARKEFYYNVSNALQEYIYYGSQEGLNGIEYRKRRKIGEQLLKNYFGLGFAYITPKNPKQAGYPKLQVKKDGEEQKMRA